MHLPRLIWDLLTIALFFRSRSSVLYVNCYPEVNTCTDQSYITLMKIVDHISFELHAAECNQRTVHDFPKWQQRTDQTTESFKTISSRSLSDSCCPQHRSFSLLATAGNMHLANQAAEYVCFVFWNMSCPQHRRYHTRTRHSTAYSRSRNGMSGSDTKSNKRALPKAL